MTRLPAPRTAIGIRRLVFAAIGAVSLLLLSGLVFGPDAEERGLFELPGDPTYDAERRAERFLPAADHTVFLFAAGRDPRHRGNVLDVEVFRALLERRDRMVEDERVRPLLATQHNPILGRSTSSAWGLPETVRAIMNGESPLIPWFGRDWDHANRVDLTVILTRLFAYGPRVAGGERHPFRALCSKDLARDADGAWRSTGLILPVAGRPDLLDDPQEFELLVDGYFSEPLGGEIGEDVGLWSYAGIERQIDLQVERALPLVGVSFLVMTLIVALFFRDLRDVFVVSLGLALLVGWIKGAQAWLAYPDTQLSALLPILIPALGVDFAIHGLKRWRSSALEHPLWNESRRCAGAEAAVSTVRSFFPALGLATATTCIAFGTALVSPVRDLREWGLLAVIAIVSAYLILGVFAVFLRSSIAGREERRLPVLSSRWNVLFERLPRVFRRRGVAIVALFALVTLAALSTGAPDADFDARDYVARDARFMESFAMEKLTFPDAGEPGYLLVEGERLAEPEVIEAVKGLVERLDDSGLSIEEGLPEPSVFDLLELQAGLLARDPSLGTAIVDDDGDGIPDSAANLIAVLGDIRREGTRDSLRRRDALRSVSPAQAAELFQLEEGRLRRLRVWFRVRHPDDWPAMRTGLETLEAAAAPLASIPGVSVTVTGPSYLRFAYVNALTRSFVRSTWIAIALCAVVLIVALRSVRRGLLTIVPVLAVAVWLDAFMVLLDVSLNIVTVQVISLSIGLGVDYSIHITLRLREARRSDPGAGQLVWMSRTTRETGLALFASAGTTLAGFCILLLSPMPLFSMFGKVMAFTILASLTTAMLLLPPLLLRLGDLSSPAARLGLAVRRSAAGR